MNKEIFCSIVEAMSRVEELLTDNDGVWFHLELNQDVNKKDAKGRKCPWALKWKLAEEPS